ncbi:hypothetical protein [Shewanella sp.]|uniref:hypothetical protein n=1 Tax=Shewanella sp. TaxID=50422 RepID=UPI003A97269E
MNHLENSYRIFYQTFKNIYIGKFERINADDFTNICDNEKKLKKASLAEIKDSLLAFNELALIADPSFTSIDEVSDKMIWLIDLLDEFFNGVLFQLTEDTDFNQIKFSASFIGLYFYPTASDELRQQYAAAMFKSMNAVSKMLRPN